MTVELRVNQVLPVLQGEGTNAGIPMLLIRLSSCDLKCHFCDTVYSQDPNSGSVVSVPELVSRARDWDWVDITGGEPLLQSNLGELIHALPSSVKIEIETSGSKRVPIWASKVTTWVVDCKCPSSGMMSQFIWNWAAYLNTRDKAICDTIKFVVGTEDDLLFVLQTVKKLGKSHYHKVVSPVTWNIKDTDGIICIGKDQADWNRRVAKFALESNLRFSIQVHKYLYGQERNDV